jgi:hypothetical protein
MIWDTFNYQYCFSPVLLHILTVCSHGVEKQPTAEDLLFWLKTVGFGGGLHGRAKIFWGGNDATPPVYYGQVH